MLLGVIVMDCSIDALLLGEIVGCTMPTDSDWVQGRYTHGLFIHYSFSSSSSLVSYSLSSSQLSLSLPLYTVLYLCRRRRVSFEPLFIATSFNRADFDFLLRPSSSTFSSFILSLPPTTTPTPTRIDITSFLPALDTYASDWPPTTTHL